MVDTNGDGDVGKLQVIKYIETKTHIDKPDYIERANEYFEQEMSMIHTVWNFEWLYIGKAQQSITMLA